jgi:hypothetical protein
MVFGRSNFLGMAIWMRSAITDLVGWVEVTKPNIAFISYLNFLGFTSTFYSIPISLSKISFSEAPHI